MNTAVIGLQWGDEGKGKIVDAIANKFDVVVRYQGGDNAGHTIIANDKTFKFNLIPSGILRGCKCILGNGMVINPSKFNEEYNKLLESKIDLKNKIFISKDATIILPMHIEYESKSKELEKIKSTGRGIGIAYLTKTARCALKIRDLEFSDIVERKLYEQIKLLSLSDDWLFRSIDYINANCDLIKSLSCNTKSLIKEFTYDEGYDILFEGAQGVMLDIEHGAYPYVTCSSPSIGGIYTGAGIGHNMIDDVIGVTKIYCTKVGGGDFPTKDTTELGKEMAKLGKEIGVVTGRPRDCGWLDLVALKYACKINGVTELALTKVDILNNFNVIKLCVGYNYNGKIITEFEDIHPEKLNECIPIYREFNGWQCDLNEFNFRELEEFTEIIRFIEDFTDTYTYYISNGPDRKDIIYM